MDPQGLIILGLQYFTVISKGSGEAFYKARKGKYRYMERARSS